ncbi:MAG: ATP-binding protein [Promethearchaeota archaeon]
MKTHLHVLIIGDSEDDAILIINELEHGGYNPIYERVDTIDAMLIAINKYPWDIIVADCTMPHFEVLDALRLLKERKIDLPFLVLSHDPNKANITEIMRAGAHDLIQKGSYTRLIPIIEREMREAEIRRKYKQMEKILRNQNIFLQNIIESITNPLYVIDISDYSVILANSAANLRNSDRSTCYSLIHRFSTPCNSKNYPCPVTLVKKNKKPIVVYHTYHDTTGNSKHLEIHGYPIFDTNGDIIQLIECILDITEKKAIEDKLKESEDKFHLLTENANDLITLLNQKFNIEYFNEETHLNLLGYSTKDLFKSSILKIIHPSDIDRLIKSLETCFEKGEIKVEVRMITKRGHYIWFEATCKTFIDKDEKQKILMISRNISERKALQSAHVDYTINLEKEVEKKTKALRKEKRELQNTLTELKKIQQRLIESEKLASIGLLSAGIAHEINNPIMGIINYAQIIKDELKSYDNINLSLKPFSFIDSLIKEGERISEIVVDLLAFARRDKGQYIYKDIAQVINSSISILYPKIKRSQIEMNLDFQKDMPKIPMRAQNIQQVILNVLQNSIDALNEKFKEFNKNIVKRIKIGTKYVNRNKKEFVKIMISDNGQGIQSKNLKKIFNPFFTTKSGSKEHGMGLGLSISNSIIKDHGGDIIIRSKWKKGTSINIFLPLKSENNIT